MATQLFGTAKFDWTDSGSQQHTLAVPLQKVRPAYAINAWTRTSLSYVNRETWVAGFVYEIVGEIRYDDTPQSLVGLLLAGERGIAITYDDGTNQTACDLIDAQEIGFDDYQLSEDWHRVEIRLRRTSGAAFPSSVFTT